eukprot:13658554-Alexandrium_andersonii.AAC.1
MVSKRQQRRLKCFPPPARSALSAAACDMLVWQALIRSARPRVGELWADYLPEYNERIEVWFRQYCQTNRAALCSLDDGYWMSWDGQV